MAGRNGILALMFVFTGPALQASDGWHESFEEAEAEATQNNLPLLIHFHASYCGPCRQMKSQVFADPGIQRQLADGIAAVEVDVSQRPDLAGRYGASTVPRDVVVYPGATPETLGIGFKSRLTYAELLRSITAQGRRYRSQIAASEQSTKPAETNPSAAPQSLLGLEGFCPVKLIRDREWESGDPKIAESYRGVTYHFSSEEQRAEFRRDPRRYTPQNLGCDPVVLFDQQKAITGKIRFGAFFDDELFLFQSPENRREFKANPLKYARIQHAIRVEELAGQRYH